MELTALLKEGTSSRHISMVVPIFTHPLLPPIYVDPRWARPNVFHNFADYVFAEKNDVENDFNNLVDCVNRASSGSFIDRYLTGLLAVVDNHIQRCGRLLFPDLLMYVDCMAYLCYASDLMTESEVNANYVKWLKFVVDKRRSYLYASSMFGPQAFAGSKNERDYNSCL